MIKSNKTLAFLYLISIVGYTFLPIHYMPFVRYLSIYFLLAWFTTIVINHNFFQSKQFLWFVPYFIIVIINYFFEDWYFADFDSVLNECTVIPIPMMITYYVFQNKDLKLAKYIVFVFFAIIIYISIVSIIIEIKVPGIIRYGLDEDFLEKPILDYYHSIGLSNYNLPHAIPFIIPPIIMTIKNKKTINNWIIAFVVLFLICALIYIGNSAGALLIGIFAVIVSSIVSYGKFYKNVRKILFVLVLFLPITLNNNIQFALLDSLSSHINDESIYHQKINDLKLVLMGEGDNSANIRGRRNLQEITIQKFINNPVWGTNEPIGHHNSFLDRMASLGLLGFIPLIMALICHVEFIRKYLSNNCLSYYYIGLISFILIMITKSVSYWETWICFATILPVSIKLFEKKVN